MTSRITMRIAHRMRDIIIVFFSVSGIAWFYRNYVVHTPRVRILVFHDVSDITWFREIIRTLTRSYAVLSPDDFFEKKFEEAKTNVLITFDDGYASWCTTVLPVLHEQNVRALFFVNSGLIDGANDTRATEAFMHERLHIHPKRALSWEGVRALRDAGHTIGGHTRTHPNLAKLTEQEALDEISSDKKTIEQRLGIQINDFAYPFGTRQHVSKQMENALRSAGYARAYTAISRFANRDETFFIPRMCIETNQLPKMVRRWVNGAYDLFDMLKTLCVR